MVREAPSAGAPHYASTIDKQGTYFALQSKDNALSTVDIKGGKVLDIADYGEALQHFCFDRDGKLRIK